MTGDREAVRRIGTWTTIGVLGLVLFILCGVIWKLKVDHEVKYKAGEVAYLASPGRDGVVQLNGTSFV